MLHLIWSISNKNIWLLHVKPFPYNQGSMRVLNDFFLNPQRFFFLSASSHFQFYVRWIHNRFQFHRDQWWSVNWQIYIWVWNIKRFCHTDYDPERTLYVNGLCDSHHRNTTDVSHSQQSWSECWSEVFRLLVFNSSDLWTHHFPPFRLLVRSNEALECRLISYKYKV